MDWLQEVLQTQNLASISQDQPQDPILSPPVQKIKPIVSSRDTLNISAVFQRSRFFKSFRKSSRSLSIKQTEGRKITLYDLKQISTFLRHHKYLHTLNLQLDDYNPPQLKILAEKLRKFDHLKAFTIDFSCSSRYRGTQILLCLPKHLRDLTYFKLSFDTEDWRSSNLNFGLKNLKHLSTLHLDIYEEYMQVEDMEIISSNLKTCRYLQNLTLDFGECDHMRNKAVYNLAPALHRLYSLLKLNLQFKNCSAINHKAAQSLAFCFNSLQGITSLALNLDGCLKMDSSAVAILSKSLKEFKNLKELDFSFPYQIEKEGVELFFQELTDIQPLRLLKFDLPISREIADEDTFKKISKFLKTQTQLQVLIIKLKHQKIKGLWAQHLAEGLKSLQSLSDLVLNFKYNESFDDKNAESLGKGLSELCSLTALQLNFKNHSLSQKGVSKVTEAIGALKNLEKLDLNLDKKNPKFFTFTFFKKDSYIKSIASALSNLNNIQSLSLDLPLLDSKHQDFHHFSSQLSTMKQLTALSLTFSKLYSSKDIERGLPGIFSSLKHLSGLTNLFLKVHSGSNEDLASVFDSLKYLVKLESLEIEFLELKSFSFGTAHQFIEAMERLEKLSKLNLNIDFEEKAVKKVSLFLSGILKLKSLSTLQFYFGRVQTDLAIGPFLENWRQIKTIKSLICYDGLDEVL